MHKSALLMLEDGTVFRGVSIGADGCSAGEVVFNTSLTGYQEILSDPSYAKQIVTLTYPHIGNVGTNNEDNESAGVFASGLVIRDLPVLASNFRAEKTLSLILASISSTAMEGFKFSFKASNSAASASRSQNRSPSPSRIETPRRGSKKATGPDAALAFSANIFPIFAFSSTVVRIRVIAGFHSYKFRPLLYFSGIVSMGPKFAMSTHPGTIRCAMP